MTEVAAIENDRRTPEACRMIHVFTIGKFASAYNWSVWLLDRCGIDLDQRLVKDKAFGGQVIRVGFPNQAESWQKYTPDFVIRDNLSTDKHVILNIPANALKPGETPEEMKRQYDEWEKARIPELIEKNNAKDAADRQRRPAAPAVQQVPVGQPQAAAPAFAQATAPANTLFAAPAFTYRTAESLSDVIRSISLFDVYGCSARDAQELIRLAQADIRRLSGF